MLGQEHSVADDRDTSCELVLNRLVNTALYATPHASIPHDRCLDPLRGWHPSLREGCTTDRLLTVAKRLRFETLLRIDEVRFHHSMSVRVNHYLEEVELCDDRPFIQFLAAFIRNNLAALGIIDFEAPSDYAEKLEQLGGKLYHIEDIIAGLEEAKLASNDESF